MDQLTLINLVLVCFNVALAHIILWAGFDLNTRWRKEPVIGNADCSFGIHQEGSHHMLQFDFLRLIAAMLL